MSRISFTHPLIDEWYEKEDEGTSTFDVCTDCFVEDSGETAETLGLTDQGYNGDPIPSDAVAEGTGSEVPDINDCGYKCEICDRPLTEENYYD